jgi:hypothetical protein
MPMISQGPRNDIFYARSCGNSYAFCHKPLQKVLSALPTWFPQPVLNLSSGRSKHRPP